MSSSKGTASQQSDPPSSNTAPTDKEKERASRFKIAAGSDYDVFNRVVVIQAIQSAWYPPHETEKARSDITNAALGGLMGIAPKDTIEGMLAAQLVATNNAAMECFKRAMIPEQSMEARDMNLSQANKLTRSSAALVQALDKHRGKGQQTVRVEHVHVHSGGQAIVGNVSHGSPSQPTQAAPAQISKADDEPMAFDANGLTPAELTMVAQEGGGAE